MKLKIIGIIMCMLLSLTVFSATGLPNERKTTLPSHSLITIKVVAKVYQIDDKNDLLGGTIHVNDTITGKYTYDPSTPDSIPDPWSGSYLFNSPPCGMTMEVNGLIFQSNASDSDFQIHIVNNCYGIDEYQAVSNNNLRLSNGLVVSGIEWFLIDNHGNALKSDALPKTAPRIKDWPDYNYLGLLVSDPNDHYKLGLVSAHVTSDRRTISTETTTGWNSGLYLLSLLKLHVHLETCDTSGSTLSVLWKFNLMNPMMPTKL